MTRELINAFGRVFLTVQVDATNKWVYANWMGYLTSDNVRTGAMAYTTAVANAGYSRVLNDTRLIIGSWDHSLEWVLKEWAPQAAKAGVKQLAMVVAPETLSESTASEFYHSIKEFEVRMFSNMEDAKAWLRQYALQPKK